MGYVRQKSQRNKTSVFSFALFLIARTAVAEDFIVPDEITVLSAGVARVALHGINNAVLAFLHDAYMVGVAVLAVIAPVEKDNVACFRLIILSLPLPVAVKPIHTVRTKGEFWHDAAFQITALVGTPRHEAGTPFHTPLKSVPAPVGLTALVAKLRQSNLHDCLIAAACERPPVWVIPKHMGGVLRVAVLFPT